MASTSASDSVTNSLKEKDGNLEECERSFKCSPPPTKRARQRSRTPKKRNWPTLKDVAYEPYRVGEEIKKRLKPTSRSYMAALVLSGRNDQKMLERLQMIDEDYGGQGSVKDAIKKILTSAEYEIYNNQQLIVNDKKRKKRIDKPLLLMR